MNIFFSIIIPTYNAEKTVASAIESIINQKFRDFEVLITDGKSSDKTSEIVNSFNDKRIILCSQKDKGVYDAMNLGIDNAVGEYIYFLGSDDMLFDNNVLQKIYENLKDNTFDLIYGDVLFASSKDIYAGEFSLERLLYKQNICHQAIFYKRNSFYKLGKYNLKYKLLADWDFNIRCFMHPQFKIKYVETCIAVYNDLTGLSKDTGEADKSFMQISPYFQLRTLKSEISNIKFSKAYGIGKLILNPMEKIISLFTKK